MYRKIPLNSLIGQEKRAITLFNIILLTVIFITDLLITIFFSEGSGLKILTPYVFVFLFIPFISNFRKRQKLSQVKYVIFLTFITVSLVVEVFVFWGSSDYDGGNLAEIYFILFSPIFINLKYFGTVILGIVMKYILIGLFIQTTFVLWPLSVMLALALVSFIILNRFLGYIGALSDSYNTQFESRLSSGISIINHTIKNEITKIQYLNSRLKDSIANRDAQDIDSMMDSIQQATSHMFSMSNRLQAKTGEILLQEESNNLNLILDSAISMIEPSMNTNQIRCIQEFKYDVDIKCDQLQLQEALMNILMNAIESMDQNGGIVTIRLFMIKKDIFIEIEDNGCGIPTDIRARVFEPFFTTRSTLNNHGLGLSYSYSVIEKHGSMEIHSEVNVGTKLSIRFPHYRIVNMKKLDIVNVRNFHEQVG